MLSNTMYQGSTCLKKKCAAAAVAFHFVREGVTREEAIELLSDAIDHYKVVGAQTTLPFGKFVCEHEAFRSGNFDTHFVKNDYAPALLKKQYEEEAKIAALIAVKHHLQEHHILRLTNA